MAYALCGKIVATPGQGDVLAGYLLDAAAALAGVDGCSLYLVNRDLHERDAVWVLEVWDDAEGHAASLRLPPVQELITRARPVIASMGERFEMEPLGGKGA